MSFRICSRLNGIKTYKTLNNEYLKPRDDFRSMTFENIMQASEEGYRTLLYNIAKKRLESNDFLKKRNITDIRKILGPTPTPEEEAKEIVRDSRDKKRHLQKTKEYLIANYPKKANEYFEMILYPENPLVEKLNALLIKRGDFKIEKIHEMMIAYRDKKKNPDNLKYKELYDKNKVALLFQLISEYRPRKKLYVGFEMYTILSSGIIRNFLELCYATMKYAIFNDQDSILEGTPISKKIQNDAVYEQSERFFRDARSIPEGKGSDVTRLIENVGTILRTLYKDEKISEPEPTYFTTEYDNLDLKTKEVLDAAVKWSFFQTMQSMRPKDSLQAHLHDFALNRGLCPRYAISYRRRGRTLIRPSDLKILIFGTSDEQKACRERITRMKETIHSKGQSQPTLTDFFR